MGLRVDLQALLEEILGTRSVYFQPPSNVQMQYPAIVYKRDAAETLFANDLPYRYTKRYAVTVIDRNPDSDIPDKIAALPMCTYSAEFANDGLNHTVFNLYF